MSCWFISDDPNTQLGGAIFKQSDPTNAANVLKPIKVVGSTSTPFDLPPGDYRFEFNIMNGGKFTLSFFEQGIQKHCLPSVFDPSLGPAAAIDCVSCFSIT